MSWIAPSLFGLLAATGLLAWRLRVGFVAFRGRFRAHLSNAPDIEWRKDTPTGMLCAVSGLPLEVDLLESYIFQLRHREDESELFQALTDALRQRVPPVTPPPFPLVRDRLLPVLRREADLVLSKGYRRQHFPVRTPMASDVVVAYVIEGQFQMTSITEGMLSAWGLSVVHLHALAVENLRTKTRHLPEDLGGPQTEYVALDGYDAARVLVLDLVVPHGISDPVVAIPHAHACLIASADQSSALAARAAALYAGADLPLTRQLFTPGPEGVVALGGGQEAPRVPAKGQHTE